jgi:hypothetical protein
MDADESECKGIRITNCVVTPGMLKHRTGHLPIEDPKLDNLRPGSGEMEEVGERAKTFN